MRTVSTSGSGKGATAPGSKPVAACTSSAFATRTRSVPAARATFAGSARRSPGTSATTAPPSLTKTSVFTIWSSAQPTAAAASAAVGVPAENSSMRASAPASRRKEDTRCTGAGHAATTPEIYPVAAVFTLTEPC